MTQDQQEFKNLLNQNKVGIGIEGVGIGDKIQYTHLPENIYKNFGVKLYDPFKYWVFDKNPYVIRDANPDIFIILDKLFDLPKEQHETIYGTQYFSRASKHCDILGIKCYLRHYNLYDQNDQNINYKKISIHTGPGKSTAGEIPDQIIDIIKEKYKDFELIQVGSTYDKNINVTDKRGSSLDEMINIIKNSFLFIGVNSGPMNIANCYPNIFRKIVLTEGNNDYPKFRTNYESFLSNEFIPQKHYGKLPHVSHENWLDFGCLYYNITKDDMGVTYSYTKI